MRLDAAISLKVGKTRYFVLENRHGANDARSGEHSMGSQGVFNVRGPALSRAKAEYGAEIGLVVVSQPDRTIHALIIARGVSRFTSIITMWDLDGLEYLDRTVVRSSRGPSRSSSPSTRTLSK